MLQDAKNDGKQCLGCEQEIGVCKMSDCLAKGNENYSVLDIYYYVRKLHSVAIFYF